MVKRGKIVLAFIFMIVLIFGGWFFFLKKETCKDLGCFKDKLLKCERAKFQREEKFVYFYDILGKSEDSCVVEVRIDFVGGDKKIESLLNKKMKCYLPLNYFEFPEREIDFCKGPLKEEVQYLMIKEAYTFISQNLGKPK